MHSKRRTITREYANWRCRTVGVEEATPLTIVLKVKNDRRLKDKSLYHRRTNLGFC